METTTKLILPFSTLGLILIITVGILTINGTLEHQTTIIEALLSDNEIFISQNTVIIEQNYLMIEQNKVLIDQTNFDNLFPDEKEFEEQYDSKV